MSDGRRIQSIDQFETRVVGLINDAHQSNGACLREIHNIYCHSFMAGIHAQHFDPGAPKKILEYLAQVRELLIKREPRLLERYYQQVLEFQARMCKFHKI